MTDSKEERKPCLLFTTVNILKNNGDAKKNLKKFLITYQTVHL